MTIRPFERGRSALPLRRRRADAVANAEIRNALAGEAAAGVVIFNVAEMMAMRSEDRDARQVHHTFADGATLTELDRHLAFLRSLGAPGDAHPRVGVNDDYEITWVACVVERRTLGRR
jgi:hypothetical protein